MASAPARNIEPLNSRDVRVAESLSLNYAAKGLLPAPAKRKEKPDGREAAPWAALDFLAYQHDFWERWVPFWDALRHRANNVLEHERAGLPPLLDFKSEILLDARRFDHPVNYALLRITEIGDDCWDDCVDINKPPVIVVDPRAGHGPGIGGFKHDF